MRTAVLVVLLQLALGAYAQSITGRWLTIDDASGRTRSVVEITEREGKVYGRIVRLFREAGEDPDPTCTKCDRKDDRYGRKVVGLEIIRGMVRDGEEWTDGTILDPESGNVYDCKLWIEDGRLKVRGYLAFFFRTQTWLRDQAKY